MVKTMSNQSGTNYLKIVFLLLFLFVLLFALGEIFLRFYFASDPQNILYSRSYEKSKGIPNGSDYNFHLNSRGYKDTEFLEKKQQSVRVLALGDSFTFSNVPYSKSYIRLLEQKLEAITPELEIVNLGLPGIGLRESLAILGREGVALQPDVLLLSIFIGDDILQSKASKYYRHSYLLSWLNTFIKKDQKYQGREYHPKGEYCDTCRALSEEELISLEQKRLFLYKNGNRKLTRQLNYTKRYLQEILELCEQNNIYPVVVLIPTVLQIDSLLQKSVLTASHNAKVPKTDWQWAQPNNLLRDYLLENKIQCIDLLQSFAKESKTDLYRVGDIHWNITGHALAAEVVAGVLQISKPDE